MLFNCDRNFTILMIDKFDGVSNQVDENLFNSRLIRMENDVTKKIIVLELDCFSFHLKRVEIFESFFD